MNEEEYAIWRPWAERVTRIWNDMSENQQCFVLGALVQQAGESFFYTAAAESIKVELGLKAMPGA